MLYHGQFPTSTPRIKLPSTAHVIDYMFPKLKNDDIEGKCANLTITPTIQQCKLINFVFS